MNRLLIPWVVLVVLTGIGGERVYINTNRITENTKRICHTVNAVADRALHGQELVEVEVQLRKAGC